MDKNPLTTSICADDCKARTVVIKLNLTSLCKKKGQRTKIYLHSYELENGIKRGIQRARYLYVANHQVPQNFKPTLCVQ